MKEYLEENGISASQALSRLGGREGLYRKVLRLYLDDHNASALEKATAEMDAEGALAAAHSIKGTSANLGFTRLNALSSVQCELLRKGFADAAFFLSPMTLEEDRRVRKAIQEAPDESI